MPSWAVCWCRCERLRSSDAVCPLPEARWRSAPICEQRFFRVESIQADNGAESPDRLALARLGPRHPPHIHEARHPQAERRGL